MNGKVELNHFNFYFPGSDSPFLQDINLSIEPGEFVAIIGSSSSGKSTLGLCLTGIYPHVLDGRTEGSISVSGIDVSNADTTEITTKIGIVFQDPDSQFCNLFVDEEVAFGPENLCISREEIKTRSEKYLKFVNLEGFNERRTSELSGGQKQRVAIAAVLAMEPDVLVLDQPTANVDPSGKEDIFETLYKLNQETGKTLILIEHQIDKLIRYVDKLVVMDNGRILFQGPPRDILMAHGKQLEAQHGLWIPEVSRAGIIFNQHGVQTTPFPITIDELANTIVENAALFTPKGKADTKTPADNTPSSTGEDIIAVEDVNFGYPSKKNVLNGVSFHIKRGSIVSLMGENGSGKTTISKMLIGLLRPASGHIQIAGMDAVHSSLNEICKKVGYVFQYPDHQFVCDTVFDEVAYGLKRFSHSEEEINQIVTETIAITELEGLEKRHPFTLSMGEKRRLSIATMLVYHPEILILDEPSAGLDYKNCHHMMQVLSKLNQEGVTIIMISHTTYLVAHYSQQVLVMDNGVITFDGTPEQLFRNLETVHTRAIEKPELLQAIEFAEAKLNCPLATELVSDDLESLLKGGISA